MPEGYAAAWRRLDDDYDRRTRQATDSQIESTLRAHEWDGGYRCRCGHVVRLPRDWGWHLLESALELDAER
jgi:hypothetical protein